MASAAVHMRGLIDAVVEATLWGPCRSSDPSARCVGACNAVDFAADTLIYTAGHPAFVTYSTGQISRPGDSDDSRSGNGVLLFAILNPIIPSPRMFFTLSAVLRCVIFRKDGLQATGASDSVQSAQRAKASLNGAGICSGCCTLKMEYAKPTRLNVFKHDQDTWDYTNPNLGGQGDPGSDPDQRQRQPLSRETTLQNTEGPTLGTAAVTTMRATAPPTSLRREKDGSTSRGSPAGPKSLRPPVWAPPTRYGPHADSPVRMVYGLDQPKKNCARVFNVFGL
ncbi:Heterogeneous nuclear ribonucleoprotein L [Plecturocebus cupreus]